MNIAIRRAEYTDVAPFRELHRADNRCQIIHDSVLRRGLGDAYLIEADGRMAGYAGVWNQYDPGRLMEFYTLPHLRAQAALMCREAIAAAGVTEIEAQTNMPAMLALLYDCAEGIQAENYLFADAMHAALACPNALVRKAAPGEAEAAFPGGHEVGDWLLEVTGRVVATGGFLTHYNPPYGDVYMEVAESARRQGYGSYLVQELKRITYEAGYEPAARCNAGNLASRRTLEKAGMRVCGRLLVGKVKPVSDG